jgi:hypothetical protein
MVAVKKKKAPEKKAWALSGNCLIKLLVSIARAVPAAE